MDFRRNIIITGGAGFIGSHVVRLFVNKYPKTPKNEKLCKNEGSVQSFFYWLGVGLFYCFTLMMS